MRNKYLDPLLLISIVFLAPMAHATNITLTSLNQQGTINGAIFSNPSNVGSVGSGTIDPFVRVHATGNSAATAEDGFNTDNHGAFEFDEVSGVHTHSLTLGSIGGEIVNAISYRIFYLDINEPGNKSSLLSLDSLKIYLGNTPSPTGYDVSAVDGFDAPGTNATLVYNLDAGGNNTILMDASLNSGSGNGYDVKVLIPDSVFTGASASDYLYLYSSFGGVGGDNAADGGYEEWAAARGRFVPPGTNVPEPYEFALLSLGFVVMGALLRRRQLA